MTRFKTFIFNGLMITIVSILIRTVSVSFNVYISNQIGAVAMGLFTLISTVYGFAITVATSGIGLATTKLVAEAMGAPEKSDDPHEKTAVFCTVRKCVIYALIFSIGSGVLLYLFSSAIGNSLLRDSRTVLSLKVLAFTLPPIALSSVFSGYFIAVRRVYKNAVVMVVGQAAKIYACVLLLTRLHTKDIESGCLAVVLGGALAEILSFLVQYLLYLTEKRSKTKKMLSRDEEKAITSGILHTALPVAFSAYVRSGLITIEHMLIPWGLERSGNTRDLSLAAYGIVQSMVFPVIFFPSALTSSFAGLLVPEIAESHAQKDTDRIERITNRVFQAVLCFSIGSAGILMFFSYALSDVLYPTTNAGKYILMIAPLVPVMYLDTSVDSLLKGLGEQVYCMGVNIVDALLSVILVWLLLPNLGITGYIVTVYFTEIVNATLSIARLFRVTHVKPRLFSWIVKPMACIIASTALVRLLLSHFVQKIESAWQLTSHIVLTVILYVFLLFVTKIIKSKRA